MRDVLTALNRDHSEESGYPFFHYLAFHNYNDFRNHWDGPDGTLCRPARDAHAVMASSPEAASP